MDRSRLFPALTVVVSLCVAGGARAGEVSAGELMAKISAACPKQWENYENPIKPLPDGIDVWRQNTLDQAEFYRHLVDEGLATSATDGAALELGQDLPTILTECAATRMAALGSMRSSMAAQLGDLVIAGDPTTAEILAELRKVPEAPLKTVVLTLGGITWVMQWAD